MIKDIFVVVISPFIIALTLGLTLPNPPDFLVFETPAAKWAICIILISTSIVSYVVNVVIPYRNGKRLENQYFQNKQIKEIAKKFRSKYKNYGIRINIMVPEFVLWHKIEPVADGSNETKLSFFAHKFAMIKLTDNGVSAEFEMSANQGICGKSYKAGADSDIICCFFNHETFTYKVPFSAKQKTFIDDLVFLCSSALATEIKDRKEIKGVLNVESKKAAADDLYKDPVKRAKFFADFTKLKSNIESQLSTSNN